MHKKKEKRDGGRVFRTSELQKGSARMSRDLGSKGGRS